jgi:O-antigen/teichoic acid export membrane protein
MIKKKFFTQVSFLWIASLLGALAAFGLQITLARNLSVESYGLFVTALAISALMIPLVGFGVSQFWLKVYGQEGAGATRWLRSSFIFLLFNSLLVLFIFFLVTMVGCIGEKIEQLLLWMLVFVLGQVVVELVSARLQLEERFFALASWQFLPHFLRLLFVTIAILATSESSVDVNSIAIIYAVVSVFFTVSGFYLLLMMKRGEWQLKGHHSDDMRLKYECKPSLEALIRGLWPFGLAIFFQIIYYQSDIVFLKYMVGVEAAGYYNVAFSIIAAIYLLPAVIYQKYLLPKMHRWANHDQKKFFQVYELGNRVMLVLGMLGLLGVWVSGFWAVPMLFGPQYFDSVGILNVLALSIPLIFLAFNSGATLVTKDNMKKKVIYMGSAAVLNIILNFILIPAYQEIGAAIATLITNLVLVALYYSGSKKHVFYTNG